MSSKIAVIICVLAFTTQITQSSDPRLQSCAKRIIEQLDKINMDKLPSCYDSKKLEEGKKYSAVFQEFYSTIPSNCKMPTKKNIGQCLKIIRELIDSKSDEMKTGLINSIHSFILGGKQCLDNIRNVFKNLDKYVLNGCENM